MGRGCAHLLDSVCAVLPCGVMATVFRSIVGVASILLAMGIDAGIAYAQQDTSLLQTVTVGTQVSTSNSSSTTQNTSSTTTPDASSSNQSETSMSDTPDVSADSEEEARSDAATTTDEGAVESSEQDEEFLYEVAALGDPNDSPEDAQERTPVWNRWLTSLKEGRAYAGSVIAQPEVSVTAAIATVAATLAGVALAGVSAGSLFGSMWHVLTEPLRALAIRRQKRWGVVRDVFTQQPVDLATVRLLDHSTRNVVRSFVTDAKGRYLFLVPAGTYLLSVTREGYAPYTSDPLQHAKEDESVEQLIHDHVDLDPVAGAIAVSGVKKPVLATVTTQSQWAQASAQEQQREDRKIRRSVYKKRFWTVVAWIGPIVSLLMLVLHPSWWLVGVCALHLVLLWIFVRLAHKREGRTWGRVLQVRTRRPIARAVVRLFDKKHGRLLLSYLSGAGGQYAFLVGDGEYLIAASKDGYEPEQRISPVKQSGGVVAQDLGLRSSRLER